MNILYCGDKNIENGLLISILSLLKNIKQELHIYVLTIHNDTFKIKPVSDNSIDYLNEIVKTNNTDNFVKKIDITELFNKSIPMINIETRFTPCCMLRLFADCIEELPDKILYLDNDVIIRKNCIDFYNQDMTNWEISGVLDYYGRWFFKKNIFKFDYINSGVLLLNLKKIKQTDLFTKCRDMCQNRKMFMPDQSALNKISTAKKIWPRKYNEQRKLHKNTVIQHFTTSFRLFPYFHSVTVKPWDIDNVHKTLKIFEYDDILGEYEKNVEKMKNYKMRKAELK